MRNQTIDVVKGVGIIAMILGHTAIPEYGSVLIYSWHMPLFFVVSGYFYRQKPITGYLRSNFSQLLVPYIITALLFIILRSLVLGYKITDGFLSIFVGAGTGNLPMMGNYFVGAIWFMLAMFWCRVIYNMLFNCVKNKYILGGGILLTFIITNYIANELYIPTDLLQGMSALLFFHIGHEASRYKCLEKRYNPKSIFALLISCALVFKIFLDKGLVLSMVNCYYPCWPIDVIAALLIIYTLYHICKYLPHRYASVLAFYGRISLLVLCVHDLEVSILSRPLNHLQSDILQMNKYVWYILFDITHIFLSLFLSTLLYKSKHVRRLFSLT